MVQHYLLTNNLILPAAHRPVAAVLLNSGALSMQIAAPTCARVRAVQAEAS